VSNESSVLTGQVSTDVTLRVNVVDEWSKLRSVIIGQAAGAQAPEIDAMVAACIPEHGAEGLRGGFSSELLSMAQEELDGLAALLSARGVVVVRPDIDHLSAPFATPEWKQPHSLYSTMPRDVALTVGELVIEAPMAWRTRYFEHFGYRRIFIECFQNGARLVAAPKPRLGAASYLPDGAVSNAEPLFDAADFVRFGDLMVGQRSLVTNDLGIEWLRRELPDGMGLSIIEPRDAKPMHIDATLMPLAEGKVLVNPDRLEGLPTVLAGWEAKNCPRPAEIYPTRLMFSSAWLMMNVLSVDARTVVIEETHEELGEMLDSWGFEVLPTAFENVHRLGGSFHCATLDLERRGD